jgi:CRP-like cAMP-binding protein
MAVCRQEEGQRAGNHFWKKIPEGSKVFEKQIREMIKIPSILAIYPDIPEASIMLFFDKLKEKTLQKGELLIREGQISNHITYIKSGIVRSSYKRDDKEITISFSGEGEFITAMSSFISQKPTYENIEALCETKVLQISYAELMALLDKDKNIEHLYRLILEQYYISLEELLIFSKFKSAKERYLELLENRPQIIQYAAVGHIASFLDMSLETLSRIRSSI